MITGENQRPWADLCPDILDSIYTRLSSHVDGTHFGSVCRSWHQIHSHISLSSPLPVEIKHISFSSSDVVQVREDNRLFIQPRRESQIPDMLVGAHVEILGRAGAWLLIKVHGIYLGCYNPLLRSFESYIDLPFPSFHFSNYRGDRAPIPINVAFSGLPTARGSMILMVYGDRYFSMLRIGDDWRWKTYDFSLGRKTRQICLGVGYKKEWFFCLFEMGDMLIINTNHNETRMLLAATKPLLPEQLQRWDRLRVLAVVGKTTTVTNDEYHKVGETIGSMVVSHWERDREASQKYSFGLVAVEENAMRMTDLLLENGDDCEMVSLEDGDDSKGMIFVKYPLLLKRNYDECYAFTLFVVAFIVLCVSFLWIGNLINGWIYK
ncbi:unnamed protein product [Linum trigynum]|uniref:DUF295 domain-containing protein n=1 Tax=Linum trigynum TaxID=586398 RepID=A0AAV2CPB8_9ROSI